MATPKLPDLAERILKGEAPEKLRRGLASGAVPAPPADLVSALAVLIGKEKDPEIREKATKTLQDLPPGVRSAAIEAELPAPIYRVLWQFLDLDESERKQLALNPTVPDDVITRLVEAESEGNVLEIVAENQQRMLRHVELVEALLDNPSLGPAAKSRVEEFFGRAYAGKVMLQSGMATKEELRDRDDWDDELEDVVENAAREEGPDEEELPEEYLAEDEEEILDEEEAQELIEEAARTSEELDAAEDEEGHSGNLRQALVKMSVPQKIKLALMGGKQARSLLVMDANKVVSSLVLKNPRLTEKEAEAMAGSKSVRDDILRGIARDRRLMKSYSIKKALAENPKTPPQIAMKMLAHLRNNDLKRLARSRNVGNAIQQQAKRMLNRKRNK